MKTALALAYGGALLATLVGPALAIESSYTAASASSADAVWAKVGDFCGVTNWFPGVTTCVLSADGKTRTTNGVFVEHLEDRNDAARTYSFTIISGPLPIANYHSKISVVPDGAGSKIVFSSTYDAAKGLSDAYAKNVIDGILKMGAESLAK